LPGDWPATWLQPETVGPVVRFVETRFDERRTAAEVRRVFPEFRDMAANAIPLRSIFVTLAKASRGRASGRE
jgi:hypothetical protein